jgi:gas vesicle protein GvpL/GvpF
VFALVERSAAPLVVAGRRIAFVDLGEVCAAVERRREPPAASEDSLRLQHAIVCRLGDRFDALLPVRFGTFVDPAELQRIAALRRDAIAAALALVRGRAQMTIRITGPLLGPRAAAAGRVARSGTEYLRARRSPAADRVPAAVRDRIASAVGSLIAASRSGDSGPRGVAIYHLVERRDVERYRSAVAALPSPAGRCAVRVSGPWPAFAFVPELW